MSRQPRLKESGPLAPAARALLTALRARGLSIPAFAEKHRLSRLSVEKVLAGRTKRLSLDLALDLRDAARAVGVRLPIDAWTVRAKKKKGQGTRTKGGT